MNKLFEINVVFQELPKLLSRLHITLIIVVLAVLIGLVLGIILAFIRLYKIPILNQLAIFYISFVRGTPILVQMFVVFYGLPMVLMLINIDINRWDKIYFVIVSYGFNTAAFMGEIFRASISGVPVGQSEAGYSVGLTKIQTFKRIIAPQALVSALPPLGVTIVNLLQDTSLAYTLGIIDVMGEIQAIASNTHRSIEGYVGAGIIFLVLATVLEKIFNLAEKKLTIANILVK